MWRTKKEGISLSLHFSQFPSTGSNVTPNLLKSCATIQTMHWKRSLTANVHRSSSWKHFAGCWQEMKLKLPKPNIWSQLNSEGVCQGAAVTRTSHWLIIIPNLTPSPAQALESSARFPFQCEDYFIFSKKKVKVSTAELLERLIVKV